MKYISIIAILIAVSAYADWQTPVNLGPPINTEYDDYCPVITTDGSFMVFVSTRPGGYGNQDLWISFNNGSGWQTPSNLGPNVNTSGEESTPYLSYDDTKLYFSSKPEDNRDIWWCAIIDGIPGEKTKVEVPGNEDYDEHGPVLTSDDNTLYFSSHNRPGGSGLADIWVSTKVGVDWEEPINLGPTLNSDSYERPEWISDESRTMVICSARAGGYGSFDFWYSTKTGDDWQEPINFGPVINGSDMDQGFDLYCNEGDLGGMMYFGSVREGGYGGRDIWTSTDSDFVNIAPASLGEVKATFR